MSFSKKYTEAELKWAEQYKGAVIQNIKYSAPRHAPTNFHYYAEIRLADGELMLSATLDMCVERLQTVAECLAYWKHFSEVIDIIAP